MKFPPLLSLNWPY